MHVALAGLKVLDLTRLLPGAFCTQLLADHGADVVVEGFRPGVMDRLGLDYETLAATDIPAGPVNTMEEVFRDPQLVHRGMLQHIRHPVEGRIPQLGFPIKFSARPARCARRRLPWASTRARSSGAWVAARRMSRPWPATA